MNNTNQAPLTAESLLDTLIGLAIRKHSNQCVFTMDSRLACSCGAELHNMKVKGTTMRLQEALEANIKPQRQPQGQVQKALPAKLPNPRTIPLAEVPAMEPPDPTEPAQNNPPENPAPVKYETGTSLPPVDMNMPLPMAQEQPHAPIGARKAKK